MSGKIGANDGDVQSSVQGYQRRQIVRFKQIAGGRNSAYEIVASSIRRRVEGTRLQEWSEGVQYRADDSDAVQTFLKYHIGQIGETDEFCFANSRQDQ